MKGDIANPYETPLGRCDTCSYPLYDREQAEFGRCHDCEREAIAKGAAMLHVVFGPPKDAATSTPNVSSRPPEAP